MKCLTIKDVANINQAPNNFDSNAIAQLMAWLVGITSTMFYAIHRYYKNKADERISENLMRKEMIESVAKTTTDESIKDFKAMFEKHIEAMEHKMSDFTKTVQDIYTNMIKK